MSVTKNEIVAVSSSRPTRASQEPSTTDGCKSDGSSSSVPSADLNCSNRLIKAAGARSEQARNMVGSFSNMISSIDDRNMGFLSLLVSVLVASYSSTNHWTVVYLSLLTFILNRGWWHALSRTVGKVATSLTNMSMSTQDDLKRIQGGPTTEPSTATTTVKAATAKLSASLKSISSKNRCSWQNFQATFHLTTCDSSRRYISTLSATEPFIPLHVIANMSLSDCTMIWRYAMMEKGCRGGGDDPILLDQVMAAMDSVIAVSRGDHVMAPVTTATTPGDMDALRFCAAVRILAEWRVVRQVPEGYKGYAVGMNLGHRDLLQNLAKVEHAVHAWIDFKTSRTDGTGPVVVTSPTLRELLQHEIDTNIHPRLPKLKDKTAAMGLLWVTRQLQYQTLIFSHVLRSMGNGDDDHNALYPTMTDAVRAAYKEVYHKYHGWAIQKIFNYSFQASPEAEVIFKYMNPKQHMQNDTMEMAASCHCRSVDDQSFVSEDGTAELQSSSSSIVSTSGSSSDESFALLEDDTDEDYGTRLAQEEEEEERPSISMVDTSFLSEMSFVSDSGRNKEIKTVHDELNPLEKWCHHIAHEWDKLGKHVSNEWNKLTVAFGSQTTRKVENNDNNNSSEKKQPRRAVSSSSSEKIIRDAHLQFDVYLKVAEPLAAGLTGVLEELNMSDPTKV